MLFGSRLGPATARAKLPCAVAAASCGFQMATLGWLQPRPRRAARSSGVKPGPRGVAQHGTARGGRGGHGMALAPGAQQLARGCRGAGARSAPPVRSGGAAVRWRWGFSGRAMLEAGSLGDKRGQGAGAVRTQCRGLPGGLTPSFPPSQPVGRRSRTAKATSPPLNSPTGTQPTCIVSGGSLSPPERRYQPPAPCPRHQPPPSPPLPPCPTSYPFFGAPLTSASPCSGRCQASLPLPSGPGTAKRCALADGNPAGHGETAHPMLFFPTPTLDHPELHHPGPLPKPAVLVRLRGGERRVLEKGHAAR